MFNRLKFWSMKVNPFIWEIVSVLAFVIFINYMVGVN